MQRLIRVQGPSPLFRWKELAEGLSGAFLEFVRKHSQRLRVAVGLLVSLIFVASAFPADLTEKGSACIARRAVFDGIPPLRYARVIGVAEAEIHFFGKYPSKCSSDEIADCNAAHLIEVGETVAVAKTCGPWAYVQHLGESSVFQGWVNSSALEYIRANVPFDDGDPSGEQRESWRRAPSTIQVKIVKGKGIPVCEAYLQRINQSVFHELPSCGRPENDQVPGFARLNRVPLSASMVNTLYARAYNLSHPTSKDNELRSPPADMSGVAAIWWNNGQIGNKVSGILDSEKISVWGFKPPVDIDNDGQPDGVVLWRNFPPKWAVSSAIDECGVVIDAYHGTGQIDKVPFILTPNSSGIDAVKSAAVFGEATPRVRRGLDPYQVFLPLGGSIDIFEYRNTYYFDTTKGPNVLTSQNSIYVYVNKSGKTQNICTYQNVKERWDPL